MIRIIVADDHPIFREGLKKIIARSHDIEVADEAETGSELLQKLRKKRYDVIVLDISMPGLSGLEALKEIQKGKRKCPTLVLSMHPEEQYAVRALRDGAAGYLTKESAPDQLIEAIRKVHRGGKYVSPALAEYLAYSLDKNADEPLHERLSDREYQVMCLMASGKSMGDIAEELFLSVSTISTYRSRILEKMGMQSNAELIYYAIKNRLIE
jgi:DNA-binding NarL/FixJ family response regulator